MTEHLSPERGQQPLHSAKQAQLKSHTLKPHAVLLPGLHPTKDNSSASETLALLKPQIDSRADSYTDRCGHHRCVVTLFTLLSGVRLEDAFYTCAVDQHLQEDNVDKSAWSDDEINIMQTLLYSEGIILT